MKDFKMNTFLTNRKTVAQIRFAMIVAASVLIAGDLSAQTMSAEDQAKFFETKIRPVLVRECYGCHSSQSGQARGGLLLDTRESCEAGGDSGPAVVPGSLDESLVIGVRRLSDAARWKAFCQNYSRLPNVG
jgi:hypothetical protein